MSQRSLLVVDCQYDFIDGSLACSHALEAVEAIIAFINRHPEIPVLYSADWHSPQNRSFAKNGGIWPDHCVANERGAELHKGFAQRVRSEAQKPQPSTLYRKGLDDEVEEYSAFLAKNELGRTVEQDSSKEVLICGIASEFCVRESVLDFLKAGRKIVLLSDALGYVDAQKHEINLKDLEQKGAVLCQSAEIA